jgi:hypothetical protein
MLVKLVKLSKHYPNDATVTVGKLYACAGVDRDGDVKIIDDLGETSFLFKGEYEVVTND